MLKTNELGSSGVHVTELGFGTASLGNLYKAVSNQEAENTLTAALHSGINYYDTAPRYGLGLSERRLGDALRSRSKADYIISTKVGRLLTPDRRADTKSNRYGFETPMPFDAHYDYSYDGIMRSFDDSLQRLGLAEIDILLVHDIGIDTHKMQDSLYFNQFKNSGYRALESLRQQKLIKAVGLGVNETQICERVMSLGQFDCFLIAGRYSLLEQAAIDSFLPQCQAHGASVILGGPYNSGILATGVKKGDTPFYNYAPAPQHIIKQVQKIQSVCKDYNVPLAAAALQFPLAHSQVATVIPGLGSQLQVAQTHQLFNHDIPDELWHELKRLGLIRDEAPVPSAS